MRHGSLFSGIGGFDLAAENMGWQNIFHCELMPFARKVLSYYWPDATSYEDITRTDFTVHRGQIDILTGGFPCQPYSAAGKRKGKDDDRHLWPHMLRCIREIRPRWVVGENVFGLVTWNAGMVFEEVCADLESEGYSVQPFVLPAAAVNAPHRRDRVWFVAYRNVYGFQQRNGDNEEQPSERGQYAQRDTQQSDGDGLASNANDAGTNQRMSNQRTRQTSDGDQRFSQSEHWQNGGNGDVTNATNCGCRGGNCQRCANGREGIFQDECTGGKVGCKAQGCSGEWIAIDSYGLRRAQEYELQRSEISQQYGEGRHVTNSQTKRLQGRNWCEQKFGERTRCCESNSWQNFPTESPICGGDDGLPYKLDGITFPKWRNESIKGYGNAIVPQVALQIFKAIKNYDDANYDV